MKFVGESENIYIFLNNTNIHSKTTNNVILAIKKKNKVNNNIHKEKKNTKKSIL